MAEILQKSVEMVTIDADHAGQRLDNFLMARLRNLPRSRLYRILRKGEVRVNKARVKQSYRLIEGDVVRIPPVKISPKPVLPGVSRQFERLLSDSILFEDDQLLVINKPAGLAVHGGSGLSLGLIEALRQIRSECKFLELVHRLDRDTSGCLVVAKKRSTLLACHAALRDKQAQKTYMALTTGRWPTGLDVINAPLRKNVLQSGERIVVAAADGKPSETRFQVVQAFADFSLVKAMPITGRTHQIRVHAKVAGHPLCGDPKYGRQETNQVLAGRGYKGLFLHATAIDIAYGEGQLQVECDLPSHWKTLLADL